MADTSSSFSQRLRQAFVEIKVPKRKIKIVEKTAFNYIKALVSAECYCKVDIDDEMRKFIKTLADSGFAEMEAFFILCRLIPFLEQNPYSELISFVESDILVH